MSETWIISFDSPLEDEKITKGILKLLAELEVQSASFHKEQSSPKGDKVE